MPPKRTKANASTNIRPISNVRPAKKRKSADRSDDSEVEFTHPPPARQPKQRSTKPAHTTTATIINHNNNNNTEQETWKQELHAMKRAKRITEDDRGFVFTRKKTVTTVAASVSASTKAGYRTNGFQEREVDRSLSLTPHPPTPERTPSRDSSYDQRGMVTQSSKQHPSTAQPRRQRQHTPERERTTESIVTIPMRETPRINKNKDMRSANRRSSLALRGKRASSIGNGFNALPHPSVDPKGFFRHIAAEDPPPMRMKQLMAWCARKTIDSQRAKSQTALKVAKLIEEDTLDMLIAGKISVSWYGRPQETLRPIKNVPKKPHKQNVENLNKLRECELQIAKLRKEDEEWTRIISNYNDFHATLLDSGAKLPQGDEPIIVADSVADELDVSLLTADERSLWEKYCQNKGSSRTPFTADGSQTPNNDKKWMVEMLGSLEKDIDNLHDTLYAASRFDKVAMQFTDEILGHIASALDERQRPDLPLESIALPSINNKTLAKDDSGARSIALSSSSKSSLSLASAPDDPMLIMRALSRLSL